MIICDNLLSILVRFLVRSRLPFDSTIPVKIARTVASSIARYWRSLKDLSRYTGD
ncbi:MAG: hypothetical protein ACRC62_14260 [Microcoleus sp.]